jgi:hypothetical protein
MDIDLFGAMAQGILAGIGALFVAMWEASARHPWIPLVIVVCVAMSIVGPRLRRRRRSGFR